MASKEKGSYGLALRYAVALFELAEDQKALDDVARDLSELKRILADSEELQSLVYNPTINRTVQARALGAVLDEAKALELTKRFVGIIALNRRLAALVPIIDAFLHKVAVQQGEIIAEVTAARPITETQLAGVTEALRSTIGGKVSVNVGIDPSLIGGLVVKIGSRLIDSSLRTKLEKLQLVMKAPEGAV